MSGQRTPLNIALFPRLNFNHSMKESILEYCGELISQTPFESIQSRIIWGESSPRLEHVGQRELGTIFLMWSTFMWGIRSFQSSQKKNFNLRSMVFFQIQSSQDEHLMYNWRLCQFGDPTFQGKRIITFVSCHEGGRLIRSTLNPWFLKIKRHVTVHLNLFFIHKFLGVTVNCYIINYGKTIHKSSLCM